MKAAFFDVDGTLTKQRVWRGLLEYFSAHRTRLVTLGFFLVINYSVYFLYRLKLVSQVNFRAAWAMRLSWLFRGFDADQAQEMWDWVVTQRITHVWREDILPILAQHKQNGDLIFLVSGGPVGLLERIAQEIGADFAVGTRHEFAKGKYTGRPILPACQGLNKPALAKALIAEKGLEIDLENSYTYADSGGDIPLLEMVGNPVAVYPDEGLRPMAVKRGWKIIPEEG